MAKKLVRCKACGYIMPEGKFHVCPACGVPEKMFEAWEDKVPENRRKVLDFHIHPIIVHAPQALGFLMLFIAATFLVLSQFFAGADLADDLATTLRVLAVLLPVLVVAGFISGLLDGYYRYKTVKSPLLVRKMIVGCLFFVFSGAMLVLAWLPGFLTQVEVQLAFLVLNLAAFGCTAILGLWGASLTGGAMPGPFVKKKPAAKPAE